MISPYNLSANDIAGVWKLNSVKLDDGGDSTYDLKEGRILFIDKIDKGLYKLKRYTSGKIGLDVEVIEKNDIFGYDLDKIPVYLKRDGNTLIRKSKGWTDTYTLTNLKSEIDAQELSKNNPAYFHWEKIKKNSPNKKQLQLTTENYVDKKIEISGFARLCSYYNYEYKNSKDTHFCLFFVENKYDTFSEDYYIYFEKNKYPEILNSLELNSLLPVTIEAILLNTKYDKSSNGQIFLEGLTLTIPY